MERSKSIAPDDSNSHQNGAGAYNFNGPNAKISAVDADTKRRKRVASYKVLAVEGRVKSSMRNGFRWFKSKYTEIRYGC
ncbi:hypothetical protein SUGI_0514720 [Cryptomeria japonica]|nr:hypothetical protein SUGI_0514720 [Cryptomeria japonica]